MSEPSEASEPTDHYVLVVGNRGIFIGLIGNQLLFARERNVPVTTVTGYKYLQSAALMAVNIAVKYKVTDNVRIVRVKSKSEFVTIEELLGTCLFQINHEPLDKEMALNIGHLGYLYDNYVNFLFDLPDWQQNDYKMYFGVVEDLIANWLGYGHYLLSRHSIMSEDGQRRRYM